MLKEHQTGIPVVELRRKHGISDATFYAWRSKYGRYNGAPLKMEDTVDPHQNTMMVQSFVAAFANAARVSDVPEEARHARAQLHVLGG